MTKIDFRVACAAPTSTVEYATLSLYSTDLRRGFIRPGERYVLEEQFAPRAFRLRRTEDGTGLRCDARGYVRFRIEPGHPAHAPVAPHAVLEAGGPERIEFTLPDELPPPRVMPSRGQPRGPRVTVSHRVDTRSPQHSRMWVYVREPGTFFLRDVTYALQLEGRTLRLRPVASGQPAPRGESLATLGASGTLDFRLPGPGWPGVPYFTSAEPETESTGAGLVLRLPERLPAPRASSARGRGRAPALEAPAAAPGGAEVLIALPDGSTLHYKDVPLATAVRIGAMLSGGAE